MTGEEHAATVLPFLSAAARARLTDLAPGSKQRTRLLNRLCHGYERTLDWRYAEAIPPSHHAPESVRQLLTSLGAGSTCYVLAMPDEWDGREVPLADALAALVGNGFPVLLICGPVAYFEPEYESGPARRFVLRLPRSKPLTVDSA